MEEIQIKYLLNLSERLSSAGFSWQHEDYFQLQKIVPKMICHICEHGDKNDGVCFQCFNESKFETYNPTLDLTPDKSSVESK